MPSRENNAYSEGVNNDNLDCFNCLQNAFHIANTFFEYSEHHQYYLERRAAHVVVKINPLLINQYVEQYSLLDEDEVNQQADSIQFPLLLKAVARIVSHYQTKLLSTCSASNNDNDPELINHKLLKRLTKLEERLRNIVLLDGETKEWQDQKTAIFFALNVLFKNENGKSMDYSKIFVAFLAKTNYFR